MNKKNVLSVKNLNKIYKSNNSNSINALNNLNLDVKEGEIFGLLGPNGAGKTTFINILAGTVIKTSGEVIVWGFDLDKNPRQVRASIGIVPQEVNLDPFFDHAWPNLSFWDPVMNKTILRLMPGIWLVSGFSFYNYRILSKSYRVLLWFYLSFHLNSKPV